MGGVQLGRGLATDGGVVARGRCDGSRLGLRASGLDEIGEVFGGAGEGGRGVAALDGAAGGVADVAPGVFCRHGERVDGGVVRPDGLEARRGFAVGAVACDCRPHVRLLEPFHDGAGEEIGAFADLVQVAVALDVDGEEFVEVGLVHGLERGGIEGDAVAVIGHVGVEAGEEAEVFV